jgi:hypothetical protein
MTDGFDFSDFSFELLVLVLIFCVLGASGDPLNDCLCLVSMGGVLVWKGVGWPRRWPVRHVWGKARQGKDAAT